MVLAIRENMRLCLNIFVICRTNEVVISNIYLLYPNKFFLGDLDLAPWELSSQDIQVKIKVLKPARSYKYQCLCHLTVSQC